MMCILYLDRYLSVDGPFISRISADLISIELNGCDATPFAVAATNHSALSSDDQIK